ncbi:polynucleotide adenylyltransferase PcnB [Marinicella gelatinilytica]|uniref:polynucleotide adenylyltransferase PcnB n=1 Tax=Marinicella gelatinilytica TaxID=2996017 RepID=UPI00226090AF|nr:polynucleotide adenylyltransferase PcnB [Marinicella gelatinilytica]MCX7545544.1 polynucleotide adenylyltransferase PcnB [Marinicella gelatinilytica]
MLNKNPITYRQGQHHLPHDEINNAVKKIIRKLTDAGYEAYLVGGAVRDLLLGLHPKDFDIATDATPENVKQVFKGQCRLIGRRFRLAHIYMGSQVYEIATFRGSDSGDRVLKKGQIIRDNVYGTIEQDAIRRDFTCNALYYDIENRAVLDFVGGIDDLERGELKLIGQADQRFIEDPVRMLRAVRFETKLGLTLPPEMAHQITAHRHLLHQVPIARLFDETVKMFHCGNMAAAYHKLCALDLFEILFPDAVKHLSHQSWHDLLVHAFNNTDERLKNGLSVTPVFLTACILWPSCVHLYELYRGQGRSPHDALHQAAGQVLSQQQKHLMIPRAIQNGVRQMWILQLRFKKMFGKGIYSTLHHPRFRAGYDFLLLRHQVDNHLNKEADFWTQIQNMPPEAIKSLIYGKRKKRTINYQLTIHGE